MRSLAWTTGRRAATVALLSSAACMPSRHAVTTAAVPAHAEVVAPPLADTLKPVKALVPVVDVRVPDSAAVDSAATPVAPLFGDSAATEGDSTASAWDMDVRSYATRERVVHYVDIFAGPARERLAARLTRGSRFEPMIRAKLRAGGLPEDMYFLALIESGYDPNAFSRAAAVGMWQFMTSTARGLGLRVDWWIDERRDPVRSTDAAVVFIRGLTQQFGSLYLAATAYNGGPGRVARGLNRFADEIGSTSGEDVFFVLADQEFLPRETREYVPQLIAATLVGSAPSQYGLRVERLAPFAYDSVIVPAATPLSAIARAADTSVDAIRELNPHILRGMTPPSGNLRVRVPVGTAPSFASRFDSLDAGSRAALMLVAAKRTQSIRAFADAHGLSERQLRWYNPKLSAKARKVAAGQKLMIPSHAVLAAAADVPDPSEERYGSSRGAMYVVKRGDNLSRIAAKNGLTVSALMRMNGLKRRLIFPGQELVVKAGHARPSRAKARATSRAKASVTKKRASSARSGKTRASKPATKRAVRTN